MPCVSGSVGDLSSYQGPIGLVVITLYHVAVGVALSNKGAKGVGINVGNRLLTVSGRGGRQAKPNWQRNV